MSAMRAFLMRAFGRPRGLLGRLGGIIMARTNADCGAWVCGLLDAGPKDSVLEVGFGPGVVIQLLSKLASEGHIAGADQSREMFEQASARNAAAIQSGRVDLRHGCVENLPFDDASFDKALAINSMQVWPDAIAGLQEIRRVLRPGGRIALGFTRHSGQGREGLAETLTATGFTNVRVATAGKGFCVLATRPYGECSRMQKRRSVTMHTNANTFLAVFLGRKNSAKMAARNALPEGERLAKEREGIAAWKA